MIAVVDNDDIHLCQLRLLIGNIYQQVFCATNFQSKNEVYNFCTTANLFENSISENAFPHYPGRDQQQQ